MPAWRSEATIQRALRSIAAQSLLPREIVVVDDGSADRTLERASEMADELRPADLKVLRQENAGPGAARNRAIRESTGSVLAFLDADDEWMPEKIEQSIRALEKLGTDRVLVAHNFTVHDGTAAQLVESTRHFHDGEDPFVELFKRGFISTSTVVCRREAVVGAGGFDETLPSGQDYELWLTVARDWRHGVSLFAENLTQYHVVAGSVSSRVELRRRCAIRIAMRHAAALRGRADCPVCILGYRIAVIAAEAVLGQIARKHWFLAAWPLIALPIAFAASLYRLVSPSRVIDRSGLKSP